MQTFDLARVLLSLPSMQVYTSDRKRRIDHLISRSCQFMQQSVIASRNSHQEVTIDRTQPPTENPSILTVVSIKQFRKTIWLHIPSSKRGTLIRPQRGRQSTNRRFEKNIAVADNTYVSIRINDLIRPLKKILVTWPI